MAAAMCAEVCALVEPCGLPHCVQQCVQNVDVMCWNAYYALLICANSTLEPLFEPVDPLSCGLPFECYGKAQEWLSCEYGPGVAPDPTCNAPVCWEDDTWRSCSASCADDTYSTECMPGMPLYQCICAVNGAAVGSCSEEGYDLADPLNGCCGSLFFGDEWW